MVDDFKIRDVFGGGVMKYFDTGGFILGRGLAGVTAAAVRSAV